MLANLDNTILHSQQNKDWYQRNREAILQKRRADYIKNKDKELKRNKEYRRIHSEQIHKQKKDAYQKHKPEYTYYNNKECSLYIGVHIAEQILSKIFKNVRRMPMHNKGYDFICNKGYKIDVKSSTTNSFVIKKNKCADYFLCLSLELGSLSPLRIWLIPGNEINNLTKVYLGKTLKSKYSKFERHDKLNELKDFCDNLTKLERT